MIGVGVLNIFDDFHMCAKRAWSARRIGQKPAGACWECVCACVRVAAVCACEVSRV